MVVKRHKHFLWKWWFDFSLTYGAFLGSLVLLPQLLAIWVKHEAANVSLLTWTGIMVGNTVWLIYGLVHKERPIIFAHILNVPISILIVIGIILYR